MGKNNAVCRVCWWRRTARRWRIHCLIRMGGVLLRFLRIRIACKSVPAGRCWGKLLGSAGLVIGYRENSPVGGGVQGSFPLWVAPGVSRLDLCTSKIWSLLLRIFFFSLFFVCRSPAPQDGAAGCVVKLTLPDLPSAGAIFFFPPSLFMWDCSKGKKKREGD